MAIKSSGVNWSLVVSAILGAGTILIGVFQFSATYRRESQEPFLQKQLDACWAITETAAKLATPSRWPEWAAQRETFRLYYWGRLAMVEDRQLEKAMYALGEVVFPIVEGDPIPVKTIEQRSLRVAYACRELVLNSWGVTIEALEGMRER